MSQLFFYINFVLKTIRKQKVHTIRTNMINDLEVFFFHLFDLCPKAEGLRGCKVPFSTKTNGIICLKDRK